VIDPAPVLNFEEGLASDLAEPDEVSLAFMRDLLESATNMLEGGASSAQNLIPTLEEVKSTFDWEEMPF
jgi:hypothetical protein